MDPTGSIDRDFVVDLLKELVATNSVNPTVWRGPGELAMSNLIFDRVCSVGGLEVRRQPVADERSNVIAIPRGSGQEGLEYTQMFSDGVVDLVEAGAITNDMKTVMPGKIAASFFARNEASL